MDFIIKAVFFIVGKIGDIILIPIMGLVNFVIPNFDISLDYIFDFLETGFQYIPFFLKSFLIPSICLQMVIIVFSTYLTLTVGVRSYNFIMKVYKNFKP